MKSKQQETVETARGDRETPLQRLERERDELLEAAKNLREVVKGDLLPICQEHGGEVWTAGAFRIQSVFCEMDDAIANAETDR